MSPAITMPLSSTRSRMSAKIRQDPFWTTGRFRRCGGPEKLLPAAASLADLGLALGGAPLALVARSVALIIYELEHHRTSAWVIWEYGFELEHVSTLTCPAWPVPLGPRGHLGLVLESDQQSRSGRPQ